MTTGRINQVTPHRHWERPKQKLVPSSTAQAHASYCMLSGNTPPTQLTNRFPTASHTTAATTGKSHRIGQHPFEASGLHCSDCLNSRPQLHSINKAIIVNEHHNTRRKHDSPHSEASCSLSSRRRIERNLLFEGPTQPQRHESNLVATPDYSRMLHSLG